MGLHEMSKKEMNTHEYLSWRRLHLSKSKLSNCIEMAEIMSAFAVVVTVELQINDGDANEALLTAFVITTSFLVASSMLAVMISTCVLPHIEAVAKMGMISQVGQSPHDKMIHLINLCWVLTNTVSIFLFTLDVILMSWIKFAAFSQAASIAATVIMGPILIIVLIFGIVFYRKIVKHQYDISSKKYDELEAMRARLDLDLDSAGSTSISSVTKRVGTSGVAEDSTRDRKSVV